MRLPLVSVVAVSALALSIGALFATSASAAPFFSLDDGTPYTIATPNGPPGATLNGWLDATLKLTEPGIVTFTDLGETSHDKVIFNFIPNGHPVTTYSDPRFISTIFGGIGGFVRFFDFSLDTNNALLFNFTSPDVWPRATYINGFGPVPGDNAALFLGSTTGERQRNHLTSVIIAFDDGSDGIGDDDRTFGDMRWMISVDQVPEPGSLVMLVTALGGLFWLRRRRAGPSRLVLTASAAVIAGGTLLSAPASATMLISFTGSSLLASGERAPISGQITFDPGAGTITSGSAESQYIGPIQGNVTFEGENFAFPGQGHVRLWDDFPINHNEFEGAFDQLDVGFFSLDQTHVDFLHINAAKVEDFVHGLSFTQSFDVLDPGSEPQNEFTWDFVSGHPQPDTISIEMRLDEVSMHPISVPEPGSLVMLVTALGGLGWMSRRRSSP